MMQQLAELRLLCFWLLASTSCYSATRPQLHEVETVFTASGARTRIYELNGTRFKEPELTYLAKCPKVIYDKVKQQYRINIMMTVKQDKKSNPPSLNLAALDTDASEFPKGSGLSFQANLVTPGLARVAAFSKNYERVKQLLTALFSNTRALQQSLKFIASGIQDGLDFKTRPIQSSNLPAFICPPNKWILFQKRSRGQLTSFIQNWNTYVNGFGDPAGNYWMGLDQLFANTATRSWDKRKYYLPGTFATSCRLRIEAQGYNDVWYTSVWDHFQVLEPEKFYELDVGLSHKKNVTLEEFSLHNGAAFSTYDKDNDEAIDKSCSRVNGFTGWWFKDCHNGLYSKPSQTDSQQMKDALLGTYAGKSWVAFKKTSMLYNCGPW